MCDEDWVSAALTNDSVVVELLLRLHHSAASLPKTTVSAPPLPFEWSVRQRRSKPLLLSNKKPTPRASPTTPLSWSGATSLSGTDGFEESSRPPPKRPDARSKATAATGTTTKKRSRKKKTLAELKEEEHLLLKARKHLKRELATLRLALEKQRATNESLNKLKLDLESQVVMGRVTAVSSMEAVTDHMVQETSSCDPLSLILPPGFKIDDHCSDGTAHQAQLPTAKISSQPQKVMIREERKFMLPDLNVPVEEHSNSKVLLQS